VAVRAAGRVGGEVVGHLAEEQVLARRAAGAGGAALGIDHHVGVRDEPLPQQRHQREQDRGGVAAGVGHQPGSRDAVAVELGQPVRNVVEQLRRRMIVTVPLPVGGGGPQTQVAREVDHGRVGPLGPQTRGEARGDAVGQREQVGPRRLVEPRLVGEVAVAGAGREGHAHARVPGQQAHHLPTGVPGGPEHADVELRTLRRTLRQK